MEPALAAVAGATRVLLRHGKRLGSKLPELVKGTTLEDLKNAKRRAEQGLDIVTGNSNRESSATSGGNARPYVIAEYAYSQTDGEAIVRWRGRRLLLSLCDAMAEGFSQTSDFISSRWKQWAVVGIVVVAGGCVLVWYFRRLAQDGAAAADQPPQSRRLVVTHRLPLRAEPNPDAPHGFDFCLDADALALQFARGLPRPVVFVGALPSAAASIPASEDLAADLLARFGCSPVFLDPGLRKDFCDDFCEQYLWPMLQLSSGGGLSSNADLYIAYLTANTKYADRVLELLNPDEDRVFIYEYHLLALAGILRQKAPRACIGFFFVHSPFLTSELLHAVTVREDLLRSLLNADLVGFHNDDCARNFLHALLGAFSHTHRGDIRINYHGRAVVLSVGVDIGRSLDQDLQRADKYHASMNIPDMSFPHEPDCQKLSPEHITPSYQRKSNRLILLGCDDTLMITKGLITRRPSQEWIRVLNQLCADGKNTVFVVSGQRKDELARWLAPCERLGISAEHGYFTRWSRDSPWEYKSGHQIAAEVNPQEVGNGTTVQRLIAALGAHGRMPDFILCIGDHGSDEDMFKAISAPSSKSALPETAEVFVCTVGNKPSPAKYYLDNSDDVLKMLKGLTDSSAQQRPGGVLPPQV